MDLFPVRDALDDQPLPTHSPPQQQPSVDIHPLHPSAAASPATPATPQTLNHPPPYSEMIYTAIRALKKKGGSSKIAIGKHIEQSYSNLPANHSTLLTQHLQRLKNTGLLLMFKKSYKLPRRHASVPETNNNNQDNAVNISSSAHGPKTSQGRDHPPKNLNAVKAQPVSVLVGLVDQTPHLMPAKRGRGGQIGGPPVGLGGTADAAVPVHKKSKSMTGRPVGRLRKVQAQSQPISNAIGEAKADAAVPKLRRSTRRPVERPMKVQAQAQPISNAIGVANAAVPKKSKSRTRRPRPVGRPRKVEAQAQAQLIPNDISEANAAVPNKSKSRTRKRRPVGRPRKVIQASQDEVVPQNKSLANYVRCLREELQLVRDDRDRQLVEHRLTAANKKLKRWLREELQQVRDDGDRQMQALTAKFDLVEHQLRNSRFLRPTSPAAPTTNPSHADLESHLGFNPKLGHPSPKATQGQAPVGVIRTLPVVCLILVIVSL